MLTFFAFVFANAITCFFAIFILVTFDVVCLKSVRLKHSDFLSHFLDLNYKRIDLNFLKLVQLRTDSGESNPEPRQNDCKSPCGLLKKINVFQGIPKKFDISENSNVNVASCPKVQNVFFNTIQSFIPNNIKPCSVTYPSTLDSAKSEI